MHVVQVHNFYKQSGGEDKVLEQEKKLLESHGVPVVQYLKSNKNLTDFLDYLFLAFNTRYSQRSYHEFSSFLDKENADIVHVHNFFPQISPSIFDVTTGKGIPSILTLHNYRLFHPNGLLMHDGEVDRRGLNSSAYRCVLDGVYRDSVIQTAVVANMIEYHKKQETWKKKVDLFIALSEFAKKLFVEGGLPEKKIVVKPNFVTDPQLKMSFSKNKPEGYLFIGRISAEKGIKDLINTWVTHKIPYDLFIIGEGPLKDELQSNSSRCSNINWLGRLQNEDVFRWLNKVKALIFPSICYEGFPITILEALSMGCPVICSNIGSQQSIIKNEVTGLHFEVSNREDLLAKIEVLEHNEDLFSQLCKNARRNYLNYYTPEKNYKMLTDIYKKVDRLHE